MREYERGNKGRDTQKLTFSYSQQTENQSLLSSFVFFY